MRQEIHGRGPRYCIDIWNILLFIIFPAVGKSGIHILTAIYLDCGWKIFQMNLEGAPGVFWIYLENVQIMLR